MFSYKKIYIICGLLFILFVLGFSLTTLKTMELFTDGGGEGTSGVGMKVFSPVHDIDTEMDAAKNLTGEYDKPVIFHCYWDGDLNEKHIMSLRSCYLFNVRDRPSDRKIIIWTTTIKEGPIYDEAKQYAEIKLFDFDKEVIGTAMEKFDFSGANRNPSFFSDVIRYILLYKYGGCWFDLDVLVLRCFDPLFANFENEVVVYEWDNQNYPNGAIFISLLPRSEKLAKNIDFIGKRSMGWGFQEANLTFDLPLDYLVLPCGWFDPFWREDNPYKLGFKDFMKSSDQVFTIDTFNGAFAFHWHNQWGDVIEENSPMEQLNTIIDNNM